MLRSLMIQLEKLLVAASTAEKEVKAELEDERCLQQQLTLEL